MLKVIRILIGRVSPYRTTPPSFTTCCSMAVQSQPERQAGSHTQQPMHRNKLWIDCDAGVDDAQGKELANTSHTHEHVLSVCISVVRCLSMCRCAHLHPRSRLIRLCRCHTGFELRNSRFGGHQHRLWQCGSKASSQECCPCADIGK